MFNFTIILGLLLVNPTTSIKPVSIGSSIQSLDDEGIVVIISGRYVATIPKTEGQVLTFSLFDPNGRMLVQEQVAGFEWNYDGEVHMSGTYILNVSYPTGKKVAWLIQRN